MLMTLVYDKQNFLFLIYIYLSAPIIIFIFWDFLMFYQIFLSPQVKWCAFTTYKHGIYELPHDLVALDLVPNIPRIIVNTQENWRTRENWLEQ